MAQRERAMEALVIGSGRGTVLRLPQVGDQVRLFP